MTPQIPPEFRGIGPLLPLKSVRYLGSSSTSRAKIPYSDRLLAKIESGNSGIVLEWVSCEPVFHYSSFQFTC